MVRVGGVGRLLPLLPCLNRARHLKQKDYHKRTSGEKLRIDSVIGLLEPRLRRSVCSASRRPGGRLRSRSLHQSLSRSVFRMGLNEGHAECISMLTGRLLRVACASGTLPVSLSEALHVVSMLWMTVPLADQVESIGESKAVTPPGGEHIFVWSRVMHLDAR